LAPPHAPGTRDETRIIGTSDFDDPETKLT
jgi:hypothetical protein